MKFWSDEEHSGAVLGYRKNGLRGAYAACPDRNHQTVYKHLVFTGVHIPPPLCESKSARWGMHEDDVLFEYYANIGAAGIIESKLLPGRTRLAITKRAAVLGLAAPGHDLAKPWSAKDMKLIRAFAISEMKGQPRDEESLRKAFPQRSLSAVLQKIQGFKNGSLNTNRKRRSPKKWTPKEDAFVISNYARLGPDEISRILRRSKAAVTNRAHFLGVTKSIRS